MCREAPGKAELCETLLLHSAFNSGPQCSMGNAVAAYKDPWRADGGWGTGRTDAGTRLDDDLALGQHWPFNNGVGPDADTAGADEAAIDAGVRAQQHVSVALGAAEDARTLVNANGTCSDNVSQEDFSCSQVKISMNARAG